LIEIINKQLLLQLVGYLCYWQMGFNSVFKGLNNFICFNVLKKLCTSGNNKNNCYIVHGHKSTK